MDIIQVIVLALIQGLTEFLPISSSAHLILPAEVLGWSDQGLSFDVAVHVGTLSAVLVYFRRDVLALADGWFQTLAKERSHPQGLLAWQILVATIPAGIAGLLFNDMIETHGRSIAVIATTTILFGLLLGWSDIKSSHRYALRDMTFKLALIIGVAQALALIPGTSRSGITITMALLLGFNREDSARFSFLLSIPVIALSGGYKALELIGASGVDWFGIILGTVISAVSAYICIHYFLSFINRLGMMPFVVYRMVLGIALILILVY